MNQFNSPYRTMNSPYLHFYSINNWLSISQKFLRIDTIFLYNFNRQKCKELYIKLFTELNTTYTILHNEALFLCIDKNDVTDKILCIEKNYL